MDTVQALGSIRGVGFLAGLRLYSTVLVLGLGIRYGWFDLPPAVEESLAVLANPIVLIAAGAAFLAEFLADKIPWVDSAWDSVHTLVRPLGAALLAVAALGSLDPGIQAPAALLSGGVALASHMSKAATRLAVNHSPEPFSNIALSVVEDLIAPFGVWLTLKYPALVLSVIALFLIIFAWLSPKVFRLVRLQLTALWRWIAKPARARREAADAFAIIAENAAPLPEGHARAVRNAGGAAAGIRAAAGKGVAGLRNSIGYLAISGGRLLFVTRRLFRYRVHALPLSGIQSAEVQRGVLLNRLVLRTSAGETTLFLFKDLPVQASQQLGGPLRSTGVV